MNPTGTPQVGSSPLTRGKRYRLDRAGPRRRLIPAHAGKTGVTPGSTGAPPAHPRSRGENKAVSTLARKHVGSSPLTRGKHGARLGFDTRRRLIPAHAGKTPVRWDGVPPSSAHPRSRGENAIAALVAGLVYGSSPLTRGKQVTRASRAPPLRLIPAHAGKTLDSSERAWLQRAHPRSRGENGWPARNILPDEGSSPLTRGKQHIGVDVDRVLRLIPAHAGKTPSRSTGPPAPSAHPRSRGENLPSWLRRNTASGSSPLTRGKPGDRYGAGRPRRLIPAHAGKTDVIEVTGSWEAAHPRSRGENAVAAGRAAAADGSSPLTRGKPGGTPVG